MVEHTAQEAGAGMAADIAEQAAGYERLLSEGLAPIAAVARQVAELSPRFVLFTARGTSDHAALFAAYLTEIRLGIPAGLASPSSITVYGARPDLRDALVVGVSQSGGSPDLTEVVRVARDAGAHTLAVTNNGSSPLADVAQLHIDVLAGKERAVAATKTYTAELLALLLLVEGMRTGSGQLDAADRAELDRLPELTRTLIDDPTPTQLAARYRFADRLVTTGRGYAYPTARETALKLMETSYLSALAFSGADLLHGPLAMADPDVPVLAMVGDGPGGKSMSEVLGRLAERRADVLVVGSGGGAELPAHAVRIGTPAIDERFSPLLDIVPMQRLALALALARGEDPDAPRGLKKVTETL
ncbi:glutamine-fructose-6-phosphate transaminase [Actinocatenispora thailandica]|uniref:Glutamine-fructose-6-phosphate transaminase n=2 Tax=Actinocatenispora thailandica TaxID=227318 RepID=A0A7R7DSM2_9ACTN|nr:glutamine-fructose-6-phosphate transaminase [Actinocatenispora thailandica]